MKLPRYILISYSAIVTLLLLLITFCGVIYPIRKIGLLNYLYYMGKIDPYIQNEFNKKILVQGQNLSCQLVENFEIVEPVFLPDDYWVEDSCTSKGLDSFYFRDQYSEDCRNLLLPLYNLPCDKDAILKSHFREDYFFCPEHSPEPSYRKKIVGETVQIKTDSLLDTWVYLPAKCKQPSVYALDFDYLIMQGIRETIQVDFLMKSLADRFRFMVKDNKVLKFDIWRKGYSLGYTQESWKKFEKPFSVPVGETVHVRLEVINDLYQISFNGKIEMTIKAKEFVHEPSFWSLIFWNGIEENKSIDLQISNFKILHRQIRV